MDYLLSLPRPTSVAGSFSPLSFCSVGHIQTVSFGGVPHEQSNVDAVYGLCPSDGVSFILKHSLISGVLNAYTYFVSPSSCSILVAAVGSLISKAQREPYW